jgi:hypothetical protein
MPGLRDSLSVGVVTVAPEATGGSGGPVVRAWSASCLVIGAMALGLAASLNPTPTGGDAVEVLKVSMAPDARCVAMAAALIVGSTALLLGLPTLLSACNGRARSLGRLAVAVYAIGVLGSAGYALLLLLLRRLHTSNVVRPAELPRVIDDVSVGVALVVWVGAFYVGLLLLAVALVRARRTPGWVPVLLVIVVAYLPFVSMTGHFGQVLQVLLFTVAMTGIAIDAVRSSVPAGAKDS